MRPIKINDIQKALAMENFKKFLDSAKSLDSTTTFKVEMGAMLNTPVTPIVNITASAYVKMQTLVNNTTQELAWHGLVKCIAPQTFEIYDILVYPQVVTGTSVDTDQQQYEAWLNVLNDDTFNAVRMQGHSHVNMSVNPSGPDWVLYDRMLQGMTRIPYYIFMIINKRNELFLMVYDFEQNVCFETIDCAYNVVLDDGAFLKHWHTTAQAKITNHTLPSTSTVYTRDYSRDYSSGDLNYGGAFAEDRYTDKCYSKWGGK